MESEDNNNVFAIHKPTKEQIALGAKVLKEQGLVDLVFSSDKRHCNGSYGDSDCCYDNKLREFIHYQPLQTFLAPKVPEGILVSSPEGRVMLREALNGPYMEPYYIVVPQIDNQEDNTCGSTSVMVALNALNIDPARPTHYQEFNWNRLRSLACCSTPPLNANFTRHQLSCLAFCNDTRVFPVEVKNDWTLDQLRMWIKMATSRSDFVLILNFGRAVMKQAGCGHVLPLSGYHEHQDMILFADIAKHKYHQQWLPLEMMFRAMKTRDDRTGLNRGFLLLMGPDYDTSTRMFGPSMLLRLDDFPGRVDNKLKAFMTRWNRFLDTQVDVELTHAEIVDQTIQTLLSSIDNNGTSSLIPFLDMTLVHFKNNHNPSSPSIVARCRRPQCPVTCPNNAIGQQIQSLDIFKHINTAFKSKTVEERQQILGLVVCELEDIGQAVNFSKATSTEWTGIKRTVNFFKKLYSNSNSENGIPNGSNDISNIDIIQTNNRCQGYIELFPEHIATFFLMSWPYINNKNNMFCEWDFIPILREYRVSADEVDVNIRDRQTNQQSHKPINYVEGIDGESGERNFNNGTSFRQFWNRLVTEVQLISNCSILQEQVNVIRRKLFVILDWHHLM